jgi:uncharacterized protein (PEP-CTERM system associated)
MARQPGKIRRFKRRTASRGIEALSFAALVTLVPSAAAAGTGWFFEPRVSLSETITDNSRLTPDKEADAITQATAGFRLSSASGRVRGFLDYSLTGVGYARHSNLSEFQNALSAAAAAELIENRAFVDVRGSIAQQTVSAFGVQSTDSRLGQDNRTEVATLGVSPYLRGRLAGSADYEARLSHDIMKSGTTSASDVNNSMASLRLSGGGLLGWSADASRQISDFSEGRHTESDRLVGALSYSGVPDFVLRLSAGRESNDLITIDKQSSSTWGLQTTWSPSVRTTLRADYEHRFFGSAHVLSFVHRSPRTVWTFVDSRDVAIGNGGGDVRLGSTYDLFFRQFASIEPDPVRRDLLVRTFLQTNGIDPNTAVVAGFLTSAATLQRLQSLSFALLGVRSTLTVQALQTTSRRLDVVTSAVDDLSSASEIRQRGVVVDVAHRLSPVSSANLAVSYQKTIGSLATQATALKSLTASWSTRLGRRSSLIAGARHAFFESATNPYRENALFATFQLQL